MWRSHLGEVSSLSNSPPITGEVDPRFSDVRQVFENNFLLRNEIGASLCVIVDGQVVVNLSGGWLSKEKSRAWSPSTLVNSFSVGKGILSILHALALTNARVSPDDYVESIWPQMSSSPVGQLSLRQLSAHQAGLPAIHAPLDPSDLYEWDTMTQVLCEQEPFWVPGSSHGYHVNTFGFLVGEIVGRLNRSMPSALLKPLMPWVQNEMFWGVPISRQLDIATLYWYEEEATKKVDTAPQDSLVHTLAYNNPTNFSGASSVNTSAWRSSVHPSTNIHTTAFAVANAYESVRSKSLPISPSILQEATATTSRGADLMLGTETHFGMGFQLPTPTRRFGPQDSAFGHYGAGGSVGFCDPVSQVSFGYVMNQMGKGWQNSRNQALIEATFNSL
jgi:CubicO group peptidase (beta-lactamase class C family)